MNGCEVCQKPVSARPPSRPAGRFCSVRCVGEHRRRAALAFPFCEACGLMFATARHVIAKGGGRFCSRRCAGFGLSKSRAEVRVCVGCGKEFRRPRWAIERGRFCSSVCYQKNGPRGKEHHSFRNGMAAFDPRRYRQHASVVRRKRLASAPGTPFTRAEWLALQEQHGRECLKCHRREPEIVLEPDHVVPIALGGSKGIENIQPLCRGCNRRKYDKHVDYRGNQLQAAQIAV